MSQQRFAPRTVTQALPASHIASDVQVSCRQLEVSVQTGAPDTSERHRVKRPAQSDGPQSVPDTDGEQGMSRLPMSEMSLSTLRSPLVSLSPFGLKHPPFASARANAFRNAASAFAKQSGLTAVLFLTATASQASFASTFLLTALIFASAHVAARLAEIETAAFAAAAPRTSPSRTDIVTFITLNPPYACRRFERSPPPSPRRPCHLYAGSVPCPIQERNHVRRSVSTTSRAPAYPPAAHPSGRPEG